MPDHVARMVITSFVPWHQLPALRMPWCLMQHAMDWSCPGFCLCSFLVIGWCSGTLFGVCLTTAHPIHCVHYCQYLSISVSPRGGHRWMDVCVWPPFLASSVAVLIFIASPAPPSGWKPLIGRQECVWFHVGGLWGIQGAANLYTYIKLDTFPYVSVMFCLYYFCCCCRGTVDGFVKELHLFREA